LRRRKHARGDLLQGKLAAREGQLLIVVSYRRTIPDTD